MFQVVVSDLDGTLLTPKHVLSPFTKKTLQALSEKNVHFVFATGRHHVDVAKMRQDMGIKAFMITSNGARVHDGDNNLIFSQNLEPNVMLELIQIAKDDPKVYTHIYRADEWLIDREDPHSLSFFEASEFRYQFFDHKTVNTSDVAKIYFTTSTNDEHEHLVMYKNQLDTKYGDSLSITFSTLNCLEVMAKGISKGNALAKVAQKLGCSLADCIAFGDGMNDYEMLSMAGKGCVMKNASPDLKQKLPKNEVIGSNADDAVSNYLTKIFKLNY